MRDLLIQSALDAVARAITAILLIALCAAVATLAPKLLEVFGLWLFAGIALLVTVWTLLSPSDQ